MRDSQRWRGLQHHSDNAGERVFERGAVTRRTPRVRREWFTIAGEISDMPGVRAVAVPNPSRSDLDADELDQTANRIFKTSSSRCDALSQLLIALRRADNAFENHAHSYGWPVRVHYIYAD